VNIQESETLRDSLQKFLMSVFQYGYLGVTLSCGQVLPIYFKIKASYSRSGFPLIRFSIDSQPMIIPSDKAGGLFTVDWQELAKAAASQ
jgi:hypothetical protein